MEVQQNTPAAKERRSSHGGCCCAAAADGEAEEELIPVVAGDKVEGICRQQEPALLGAAGESSRSTRLFPVATGEETFRKAEDAGQDSGKGLRSSRRSINSSSSKRRRDSNNSGAACIGRERYRRSSGSSGGCESNSTTDQWLPETSQDGVEYDAARKHTSKPAAAATVDPAHAATAAVAKPIAAAAATAQPAATTATAIAEAVAPAAATEKPIAEEAQQQRPKKHRRSVIRSWSASASAEGEAEEQHLYATAVPSLPSLETPRKKTSDVGCVSSSGGRRVRLLRAAGECVSSSEELASLVKEGKFNRPAVTLESLRQLNDVRSLLHDHEGKSIPLLRYAPEMRKVSLGEGGRELLRACLTLTLEGCNLQGASLQLLLDLAFSSGLWPLAQRIVAERATGNFSPLHFAFIRFKALQARLRKQLNAGMMLVTRGEDGLIEHVVYEPQKSLQLGRDGRSLLKAQLCRHIALFPEKAQAQLEAHGMASIALKHATVPQLLAVAWILDQWSVVVQIVRSHDAIKSRKRKRRTTLSLNSGDDTLFPVQAELAEGNSNNTLASSTASPHSITTAAAKTAAASGAATGGGTIALAANAAATTGGCLAAVAAGAAAAIAAGGAAAIAGDAAATAAGDSTPAGGAENQAQSSVDATAAAPGTTAGVRVAAAAAAARGARSATGGRVAADRKAESATKTMDAISALPTAAAGALADHPEGLASETNSTERSCNWSRSRRQPLNTPTGDAVSNEAAAAAAGRQVGQRPTATAEYQQPKQTVAKQHSDGFGNKQKSSVHSVCRQQQDQDDTITNRLLQQEETPEFQRLAEFQQHGRCTVSSAIPADTPRSSQFDPRSLLQQEQKPQQQKQKQQGKQRLRKQTRQQQQKQREREQEILQTQQQVQTQQQIQTQQENEMQQPLAVDAHEDHSSHVQHILNVLEQTEPSSNEGPEIARRLLAEILRQVKLGVVSLPPPAVYCKLVEAARALGIAGNADFVESD